VVFKRRDYLRCSEIDEYVDEGKDEERKPPWPYGWRTPDGRFYEKKAEISNYDQINKMACRSDLDSDSEVSQNSDEKQKGGGDHHKDYLFNRVTHFPSPNASPGCPRHYKDHQVNDNAQDEAT